MGADDGDEVDTIVMEVQPEIDPEDITLYSVAAYMRMVRLILNTIY